MAEEYLNRFSRIVTILGEKVLPTGPECHAAELSSDVERDAVSLRASLNLPLSGSVGSMIHLLEKWGYIVFCPDLPELQFTSLGDVCLQVRGDFQVLTAFSVLYLIVTIGSVCLLVYGALHLVGVLFARVDPKEFSGRGANGDSLFFFSSIARNGTLSAYREKLKECSEEQMKDDFIRQIYTSSLICDKKFALYKKGLICSVTGFFTFPIMAIIGALAT